MTSELGAIYILSFLCFLPILLMADEPVKIARVLDANLFELKDGRKIKLANLETPSIHDPDPYRASLAKMIKKYGQERLAGQTLLAEFVAQRDSVPESPIPDSGRLFRDKPGVVLKCRSVFTRPFHSSVASQHRLQGRATARALSVGRLSK